MNENNNFQLNLTLESFTGPLDVLENLIRTRKMDILNLDIAELANQYVKFINENIDEIKIEVASDYLVMATYLLELKSKKMLPIDEVNDISSAFDDERQQLINRLIEYRKYKETLPKFFAKQTSRENFAAKDPDDISKYSPEIPVIEKMPNQVNPEKLLNAFINALNKYRFSQIAGKSLRVKEVSVDVVKKDVLAFLDTKNPFTFDEFVIFSQGASLQYVVTCFLAILELAKYQKLIIDQDEKNITIKKYEGTVDLDSYDNQGE